MSCKYEYKTKLLYLWEKKKSIALVFFRNIEENQFAYLLENGHINANAEDWSFYEIFHPIFDQAA